ncbi:MAG: LysR family transcriptional regulator [Rhizobacter sp.]|nr:LysR family transcriptional regulator [Rhizobacter sp.]
MLSRSDERKKRRIRFTMIEKPGQQKSSTVSRKSAPQSAPRLRLSLRQLEVFAAIAHSGPTREAAGRVARSQSAASAALAELETALGAPLFDRVGRRLVLNENGRALLPGAVALLDRAAELQALFTQEHAAPLRVAASLTIGEYLLPALLAQWKLAHPNSAVHLAIGNTSKVIAAVAGLEADVGFIEGPQTHADLRVLRWVSDELVVVAAPGHPLAAAQAARVARVAGAANATRAAPPARVSARQLAEASWILREHGSGTRLASDRWLIEHLGSLNIGFELGSTEAIKRLAAAGAGLACLSRHTVAEELASSELVALRTRLPIARRRLAIVVRRDKHLGRATEDFIGHCVAMAPAGR